MARHLIIGAEAAATVTAATGAVAAGGVMIQKESADGPTALVIGESVADAPRIRFAQGHASGNRFSPWVDGRNIVNWSGASYAAPTANLVILDVATQSNVAGFINLKFVRKGGTYPEFFHLSVSIANARSAANQAAKGIGEGLGTVGENITQFATDKETSETNAFVADLMAAGSQEERDAMIGAANDSWLNMKSVNATNFELGAPDRELDMYNQKLASKTVVDQAAAELLAENQMALQGLKNSNTTYKKPTSGIGSTNFGKNPIGSDGIFATNYPKNDNITGWGGGYDSDDDEHFVASRASFLNSKYAKDLNITAEMFNQLANDELITFEDRKVKDQFIFQDRDGGDYELDDSDKSHAAIAELIENKYFETSSVRQVNKSLYFDAFAKNNPEIVKDRGIDGTQDLFTKIYNRNIKYNSNKLDKKGVSQIFGKYETSGSSGEFDKDDVYQNAYNSAINSYSGKAYDDEDIKRLFKTYSDSDITTKKDQARLDALEILVNAIK